MNIIQWPTGFQLVPDEAWAQQALEELAMKYDTVEEHGWYDNLDSTVEQLIHNYNSESVILDYSGGTGILTDRLMRAATGNAPNVLIVDSSPKFLRLALEKLKDNPKVAYRLIRYLRSKKRLQSLKEVIDPVLYQKGIDAVVSTNAIHLYYGLSDTLGSWNDILCDGGRILVQSGNIRNPDAPQNSWIIDETVEHIHRAVIDIVKDNPQYDTLKGLLANTDYMTAHDRLRQKYFLPVRDLEYYTHCISEAGFTLESVTLQTIEARVDQWYSFLEVYHEGVLGWVGGAEKITKSKASQDMVNLRKELMWKGMQQIFSGKDTFDAVWTYITARKA